jgi:hypothetical protein
MNTNVENLVNAVRRGILTAAEALAKEYLTPAERAELRAVLRDDDQ